MFISWQFKGGESLNVLECMTACCETVASSADLRLLWLFCHFHPTLDRKGVIVRLATVAHWDSFFPTQAYSHHLLWLHASYYSGNLLCYYRSFMFQPSLINTVNACTSSLCLYLEFHQTVMLSTRRWLEPLRDTKRPFTSLWVTSLTFIHAVYDILAGKNDKIR